MRILLPAGSMPIVLSSFSMKTHTHHALSVLFKCTAHHYTVSPSFKGIETPVLGRSGTVVAESTIS